MQCQREEDRSAENSPLGDSFSHEPTSSFPNKVPGPVAACYILVAVSAPTRQRLKGKDWMARRRAHGRAEKRESGKAPSIRITGPIDERLLRRVIPQIQKHRRRSPEGEIVVSIDSEGGLVGAAELIWEALDGPSQNERRPTIIGIAGSRACSVAAHLLARSDYAIVSRRTLLHFHGTWTRAPAMSALDAASASHGLYHEDDRMAVRLAPSVLRRLLHTYGIHREAIARIRGRAPREAAFLWGLGARDEPDVACLVHLLRRRVGKECLPVVSRAFDEFQRIFALRVALERRHLGFLPARFRKHLHGSAPRRLEAIELRLRALLALIEERLFCEGPRADFSPAGVYELALDLEFLTEVADPYFRNDVLGLLLEDADRFFPERDLAFLLASNAGSRKNRERFDRTFERAHKRLYPAWLFARVLCRRLARGENRIPPVAAWWLGLVDEVEGTQLSRRPA